MRGRFAPSPTGRLHLGNARSALLGWLQARAAGGQFLLRIEDLDPGRVRAGFVDDLFRDLEYLGLGWDETPLFQSQRSEVYRAALETLARDGRVFPCFCSRAEIARAASAPHGLSEEGPVYPGTCRALTEAEIASRTRTPALRFRAPSSTVTFDDEVHGVQTQEVAHVVGDFVVRRNDGVASYQLAVVVDDAATGITHVLRGDDLLTSTPRQILLYEALGHRPPRFAHVPLVLGEDGKRLAKREGPFAVTQLREAKVPRERVVGLLAAWSGLGDGTPVLPEALVPGFSLQRVRREAVVANDAAVHGLLA